MYPLLTGLRIIECASFIAAPSCALHLRQLGAEVIRIDPIGGGPDFHRWPLSEGGHSYYWEGLNKGKKSIAVDFSRPEGRQLVADLITAPGADGGILVTNFPKDGFLAHERLSALRPDLITVRVTGWRNGDSGLDYTINAALGIPLMTGGADNGERPVNHVLPAWDLLTGAYAAFVTLAAERDRLRTGRGQEVTVPLSDVALAALGNMGQIAEVLAGGERPRHGNALFGAFGRDFMTSDGERVMVAAITRRQWTGLLAALQIEQAVARLESVLGVSFEKDEGQRFVHREALFPLVEQAIGALPLGPLRTRFDGAGVCWSPYMTLSRALREDPRLSLASSMFSELAHPSGHRYPAPGAAATLSGIEREPGVRAPHLGEHTDAVLADVLALSPSRIGELHDAGLVAGPAS
ncbi:CoA transferase [Variovorax rhizosphaerae]|uniref:CoA transferase n=1 Tax=Variovorax rhizosphaerae TaxID=1836200 RepID=A0ABU8WJW5_9BURK